MLFVDFPVCLYWPDSYTAIMKLKLIFSANNLQITVFTLVKKLLMMMNLHIFPNTIKEMYVNNHPNNIWFVYFYVSSRPIDARLYPSA